ncbi:hypothetical protein KIPB_005938, partial [Kipferlia bialata]
AMCDVCGYLKRRHPSLTPVSLSLGAVDTKVEMLVDRVRELNDERNRVSMAVSESTQRISEAVYVLEDCHDLDDMAHLREVLTDIRAENRVLLEGYYRKAHDHSALKTTLRVVNSLINLARLVCASTRRDADTTVKTMRTAFRGYDGKAFANVLKGLSTAIPEGSGSFTMA